MNQKSGAASRRSAQGFTEKQGQYLAFVVREEFPSQ
jgi:hypothetical protein